MEHTRPTFKLVQLIREQCIVKLANYKRKRTSIFKKKEFDRCTVFQCNRISHGGLRSDGV